MKRRIHGFLELSQTRKPTKHSEDNMNTSTMKLTTFPNDYGFLTDHVKIQLKYSTLLYSQISSKILRQQSCKCFIQLKISK